MSHHITSGAGVYHYCQWPECRGIATWRVVRKAAPVKGEFKYVCESHRLIFHKLSDTTCRAIGWSEDRIGRTSGRALPGTSAPLPLRVNKSRPMSARSL